MRKNEQQASKGAPLTPCLWYLRRGLLLGGILVASHGAIAFAGEAASHPAPRTLYRVINLEEGTVGARGINASGQVAYTNSHQGGGVDSPIRARFFDGATIRDLGTLGGRFSRVTGLNDAGEVTGVSEYTDGNSHGFIWSRYRGIADLGLLPGTTTVFDPVINGRGQVAGYAAGSPLPYPHAFLWSRQHGMEDLGGLLGGADAISYGRAINDAGMVVGISLATPNASNWHAFAWTRATGMIDIDTLGNSYSDPVGVSASGLVAGNFFVPPQNFTHVFVWTRARGMRDLGTAGAAGSWMTYMSASGRVTGLLELADNSQHAMTWAPQQAMLDLGTLGGNLASANAANNRGQVVGGSSTASGAFHAFVWTSKEGMVDLNTRLRHAPAGLTLYSADAVSDNGAIVASANTGLVLLTPDKGRHTGHTAGPIVCPDMVRAGTPLDASLGFVTEEPSATYKATWSWGDGSGDQAAAASAPAGEGKAAASHVYTAPGMYTVTASVADAAGNSTKVTRKVIVYEPSEGVVGGAGAFVSPAKRIGKGTMPGGRATFSFVAPSVPAAKAVRTNGQLTFSLGGMNFQSVSLGLTALQGTSAQFAGSGKMNGAGNYKFTLQTTTGAANTGQPGRFGLRIWHADPATGSDIVDYDNLGTGTGSDAAGHPIAEGAITVQR